MESEGFTSRGDVLEPFEGGSSSIALWDVDPGLSFSLKIEAQHLDRLMLGLVPADLDLRQIKEHTRLEDCRGLPMYRLCLGSREFFAFDQAFLVRDLHVPSDGTIFWEFQNGPRPRLLLKVGERGDPIDLFEYCKVRPPHQLCEGTFKPFIRDVSAGMMFPKLRIRCTLVTRRVRPCIDSEAFIARANRLIWEQRKYTDLVVKTNDGHKVCCHRAFLLTSPVFAVELERWVKEPVEISVDGCHSAVEGMLEFLYTGQLSIQVDAAAVLPLAHRYQIDDLTSAALRRLLDNLGPATIAAAARALRPLREEEGLRQAWAELCRRAAQEPSIIEALALAV
mmetsp:Transcript_15742/g.44038  ORF Transcript_15742/g.44038 Transcript_15742/m.44038 type:complete len:337 (-) Transcript_15742:19-1029(-)